MKICSSCGSPHGDNETFCANCGTALNNLVFDDTDKTVAIDGVAKDNFPVNNMSELEKVHNAQESDAAYVDNSGVQQEPVKKKKKGKIFLIISLVLFFIAITGAVVAGVLTNWFGLAAPFPKIVQATAKTLNSGSMTIKTTTSYTASGDSAQIESYDQTIKYVFNEGDKKIVSFEKGDDYSRVTNEGFIYSYYEYSDGEDFGFKYEDKQDNTKFFKLRDYVSDGKDIDYKGIVELYELQDIIEPDKADEFVDELFEKYLNDKKWLKETAGYKKEGKAYTFKPDIEKTLNDFAEFVEESDCIKEDAKKGIVEDIDYIVEEVLYDDISLYISITLKKGYLETVKIELSDEEGHSETTDIEFSDYEDTEITQRDVNKVKNKVDEYIEANSCVECGEYSNYTVEGKNYCYGCYKEKFGGCDKCTDSDDSYTYDGYKLCKSCYDDMKNSGCDNCDSKSAEYFYDGKDLCKACYDKLNTGGCDKCSSKSNKYSYSGYKLCYDCYYEMKYLGCDLCSATDNSYYYGGYYLCYDCYYDMKYSTCDYCGYSDDSYYYNGYDLCYDCYYELRYTNCDVCGDSDDSYYYDGYDLCWDCYYDMLYYDSSTCDMCGDSDDSYYYDGYDLCWDCYYDMYYDSSTCDMCGDSDDSYYYDGYDLCWDCYYDMYYGSSTCDMCGDSDDSYYYDGYDLCWDCYYDMYYGSSYCDVCGDSDDSYYYDGYDLCYDCYYDMKYGYSYCDMCGSYEQLYSYDGYDMCWDCYWAY